MIRSDIRVRGIPGGGLPVVAPYLKSVRDTDVFLLMLGCNDVCRHPRYHEESLEMTLSHVITYDNNLRNFCNHVQTKLVIIEIISRDSLPKTNQLIAMLKNRLREKIVAHVVDLESDNFTWLQDKVHLTKQSYKEVAKDINKTYNGPQARPDLVDHKRLCDLMTFALG